LKVEHRGKIEEILDKADRDYVRLHGQKLRLRKALYEIRKINVNSSVEDLDIEEVIRKTLVLTFG